MEAKNIRYFQWIMGDNKGEIKIFDKVESEGGDIYVVFKDNSRINENLIASLNSIDLTGKMMAEIDHPTNCWTFKEEWVGREEEVWEQNADGENVCVQPFVEGRKTIKLIPPKRTAPTSSRFGWINNPPPPPPPPTPLVQPISNEPSNTQSTNNLLGSNIDKTDPVYILMSKAKKIDMEISMGITVALPPKNLYNIAKESFENGDEKFITYIVDELTVKEIKDAIKIALREMYDETLDNKNI